MAKNVSNNLLIWGFFFPGDFQGQFPVLLMTAAVRVMMIKYIVGLLVMQTVVHDNSCRNDLADLDAAQKLLQEAVVLSKWMPDTLKGIRHPGRLTF